MSIYSESLYDDIEAVTRRSKRQLNQNDSKVPWGTGLVEGAKDLGSRAVNQLQEWAKEDPDTWTDDLLRLTGGGIKNTGAFMSDLERRSEEGEVGIRSAAGTALRFMNWSSEQGARLGRTGARAIGVNEELGGFLGSFLPEAIGTKGLSKAAQIGKTTKQLRKLRKLGYGLEADAITKGKYAFAYADEVLPNPSVLDDLGTAVTSNKTARRRLGIATEQAENISPVIKRSQFRNIKGMPGADEWREGAYAYMQNSIKEGRTNLMQGYPNFNAPDGRVFRATPQGKGLTAIDEAKKQASRAARGSSEEAWKIDLKEVLTEFDRTNPSGKMLDKYDEMVKTIKKGNKVQDTRRTRLNKQKVYRGDTAARDMLTIEHIGALKNKWPDVPENRWGLIKRHLNSKAGAKMDPPDINIRMQGTPRNMKEWVIKQELAGADITAGLPIKVKRQILAAVEKVKSGPNKGKKIPDTERIDEILEAYYKSVDAF